MPDYNQKLSQLLEIVVDEGASDLHISVGRPPTLRVSGRLTPLVKHEVLSKEDAEGLGMSLLTEDQRETFKEYKEVDLSYVYKDKARFRVNVYCQSGFVSIALRFVPAKIRTIEELGMPPILHRFTTPSQGFFVIVGPSGQGKSTTLAALIDEINHTRQDHIITIEDPIEYIFTPDRCIIDQREVGRDTKSFSSALRSSFRQDPNVLMVGEMRDAETMATAISAAETGHLVFATLHTNNAAQTIHRIIDSFPAEQQNQIRSQLSLSLIGVVSQRLVPTMEGELLPACEIMIVNSAIRNLIRDKKIHEIDLVIETSSDQGMLTLNRSLANLVKDGVISLETAETYSLNAGEVRSLVGK
ncbi:MAG: type IV pili twitching motility protein PilT [Candidatus Spechtbacteria bacterium RIFCSPHIGHO2_02_FULL_43_15b]|uniref:Type IV pili twitching motility protein PilT n=1 Tax=Candidatus Spechtbacteria bacterium RIFCSPHIGHO2_01_FULL_43_30 TaxID=1802158 RepID=A0A1G2H8N4_9BACT|nr:MAG: type IV pili twitching motility protein PilT [Candidatus Spechtbacteria bacterium RIFCSPHIGHO2_01_FULL_43_30]OGZ59146.1 MAG: type IV pili twitching motility protein PilT [Candidatus Spechtbacteria bacterium RIFCSPHIGHO2_02_FULL_43_15b]